MSLAAYASSLTNSELAELLEYSAPYHEAPIAAAVMREAARRLREDPEHHFVMSRPPDLPPLKAYATANSTQAYP